MLLLRSRFKPIVFFFRFPPEVLIVLNISNNRTIMGGIDLELYNEGDLINKFLCNTMKCVGKRGGNWVKKLYKTQHQLFGLAYAGYQ